ncbi:aldehyde dehydrogenase family protein [Streptomyces sp. NPDC087425]|uniref:aldehyde dehydrogenase family protein n=1 Tax=Streptomyces sp. NPDC087425 TaxID=3365787 RepID=UPI0037F19A67
MRIAQEEVFGPVVCVILFDGAAEAVEIADGTVFGLVRGVHTADGARALRAQVRFLALMFGQRPSHSLHTPAAPP